MSETTKSAFKGVKFVRAQALRSAMGSASGNGRATAFDFAGTGGRETWIGAVSLKPRAKTTAHHHGRHEVAVYVVKGRGQIQWGDRLEFAEEVNPGDFVYFAPYVPHQEMNLDAEETLDLVVVRSDNEKIVVNLDVETANRPGDSGHPDD
jgi:uncharacterized RmlC-like cupin family protein